MKRSQRAMQIFQIISAAHNRQILAHDAVCPVKCDVGPMMSVPPRGSGWVRTGEKASHLPTRYPRGGTDLMGALVALGDKSQAASVPDPDIQDCRQFDGNGLRDPGSNIRHDHAIL